MGFWSWLPWVDDDDEDDDDEDQDWEDDAHVEAARLRKNARRKAERRRAREMERRRDEELKKSLRRLAKEEGLGPWLTEGSEKGLDAKRLRRRVRSAIRKRAKFESTKMDGRRGSLRRVRGLRRKLRAMLGARRRQARR